MSAPSAAAEWARASEPRKSAECSSWSLRWARAREDGTVATVTSTYKVSDHPDGGYEIVHSATYTVSRPGGEPVWSKTRTAPVPGTRRSFSGEAASLCRQRIGDEADGKYPYNWNGDPE